MWSLGQSHLLRNMVKWHHLMGQTHVCITWGYALAIKRAVFVRLIHVHCIEPAEGAQVQLQASRGLQIDPSAPAQMDQNRILAPKSTVTRKDGLPKRRSTAAQPGYPADLAMHLDLMEAALGHHSAESSCQGALQRNLHQAHSKLPGGPAQLEETRARASSMTASHRKLLCAVSK